MGLKTLPQQGISEPIFYGDLVYKFKRVVRKSNFSDQKDCKTLYLLYYLRYDSQIPNLMWTDFVMAERSIPNLCHCDVDPPDL